MTISPRLTRAALAFLLFGTIAALLPAQDNAALAGNGCATGPAGSTGQLAIAPTSSTIQNSYTLVPGVPAPATYRIYFKPDANSPYATLNTGDSRTTFTLVSGQVVVNNVSYSANNITSTAAPSFTAAQAFTRNSTTGVNTYVSGSMTASTSYVYTNSNGIQTAYVAQAGFSAP